MKGASARIATTIKLMSPGWIQFSGNRNKQPVWVLPGFSVSFAHCLVKVFENGLKCFKGLAPSKSMSTGGGPPCSPMDECQGPTAFASIFPRNIPQNSVVMKLQSSLSLMAVPVTPRRGFLCKGLTGCTCSPVSESSALPDPSLAFFSSNAHAKIICG